ncbi:MAG: hypothetical protein IPJ13_15390 [Saprospiraceae bacterium]|nr:hypothetical protein [Saprospiraceae bacterium]
MSNDFTTYLIKNGFVARQDKECCIAQTIIKRGYKKENINTEEASYKIF